jgi:hypothetical protein
MNFIRINIQHVLKLSVHCIGMYNECRDIAQNVRVGACVYGITL